MSSQPEVRRPRDFAAVVLAGQRPGIVDALAIEAGVSHKCLVPIGGAPLILHVLKALRGAAGMGRLRIVIEPAAAAVLRAQLQDTAIAVEFIPAADNLADSVYAATGDLDEPTLITTADNVLLTPAAVEQVMIAIDDGADVAIAMSRRAAVLAAHPDGQRRFYQFRDDAYSNCNLYGFCGPRAFAAAESFRSGGQFAKKPVRLVMAVGLINVALMLLHRLSLTNAMRRLSKRLGLRLECIILADGAHAIDVDNPRTFAVASQLIAARQAARANRLEEKDIRVAAHV